MSDTWNAIVTPLDEPIRATESGPLAGRRLAVKDLIDVAGVRTTYGLKDARRASAAFTRSRISCCAAFGVIVAAE